MNRTKIDWGYGKNFYTWNIITGCLRNPPCSYCYARRIHERFNKTPFSEIQYHPTRMDDLETLGLKKEPCHVFVGSMSDIEYWPEKTTQHILHEIKNYHRHTFMFLSKNPDSYWGFNWPANTMQGLTMTCEKDYMGQFYLVGKMVACPHPFLSIEPLLGNLLLQSMPFERVIVGAMSGPGAVPVKKEWVRSIKENVPADKIFWKASMKEYL